MDYQSQYLKMARAGIVEAEDIQLQYSKQILNYGIHNRSKYARYQCRRPSTRQIAIGSPEKSYACNDLTYLTIFDLLLTISVRDKWESEKPELEKKASEILGVPWTFPVDYTYIWPHAERDLTAFPAVNPGGLVKECVSSIPPMEWQIACEQNGP